MSKNRRPAQQPGNSRYPGGRNTPRDLPRRTPAQTVRLWVISLLGAAPGAYVAHLTGSYWKGAAVFLTVVLVLGFGVYLYEKSKKQ